MVIKYQREIDFSLKIKLKEKPFIFVQENLPRKMEKLYHHDKHCPLSSSQKKEPVPVEKEIRRFFKEFFPLINPNLNLSDENKKIHRDRVLRSINTFSDYLYVKKINFVLYYCSWLPDVFNSTENNFFYLTATEISIKMMSGNLTLIALFKNYLDKKKSNDWDFVPPEIPSLEHIRWVTAKKM